MVVGTSAKLAGYGLVICFSLPIEVLKVFVGCISADGGQVWVIETDIFDIYWFGCTEHL